MTTEQATETASEGGMAMHTDWWTSGWNHVLPQHQGMMLCLIFGTATTRGLEGDLDGVVHEIFGDELRGVFHSLGENLDSPILWIDEEEVEDAESEEEKDELRAAAKAHEATLTSALQAAGMTVPVTIRELAHTMVELGIATTRDGTWSMPEVLPRPDDVLTLPDDVLTRLQRMRQFTDTEAADQAIVRHLIEDLDYPEEVFTSLDRFVAITGEGIDKVRAALDQLVELGDARLYRGDPQVTVAAKDLPAHARFHLVPDWERFNEHRMHITREG
ncbi:DUF6042 family protein [Streptomyces sp. ML-6]|uniref:DUF6042 family protein n=1 Tax=Streptomyces sp. ML-6 TaxID=2982693 RepID=UPI0024BFF8C5|nr:DUF6042 family protein [Streptomyces sp. ML-6]MDK0525100.1 DUF6042 family protein [Streptomyces sp. ML-6]